MTTALVVIGVSIALGIGCMLGALYLWWRTAKRTQSWWDGWMP